MNSTHGTLLKELKEGNETAWWEFRNTYRPLIFHCARKGGLSAGEFILLEQEVLLRFLKVSRNFEYDPRKGRFRTYLGRIVQAAICDIRRNRPGRSSVEIDSRNEPGIFEFEWRWEEDWRRHVFWRAMKIAAKKYPPHVIMAFRRNVLDEVPAESVAKELDICLASVYNYRNKVLAEIKRIVTEINEEERKA